MSRHVYRCGSWRHAGDCARHEAAVTFARIKEAVSRGEYSSDGWVFMVLTLDRDAFFGGKRWIGPDDGYRALSRMTRLFLKRLRRLFNVAPGDTSSWVAVVEAHRSGWPHVNLLLYCPSLARELEDERTARLATGATEREATLLHGELKKHAISCDWGPQSTAEAARSTDALAGYFTKLAGQHDATVGEIAKLCQAPVNAPKRFRRLRSGKGFLPPRRKGRHTGVLLRRRPSREGDLEICKVNPPKDPAQNEAVAAAVAAEWEIIREEQEQLSRNGGELPPQPPLRIAVRGQLEPADQTRRFVGFDDTS